LRRSGRVSFISIQPERSTIDEGIEILTGVSAGDKQKSGTYPKSTVNYLIAKRLKEMAERLKDFRTEEKKETV
jgi:hypothetical protein